MNQIFNSVIDLGYGGSVSAVPLTEKELINVSNQYV
jgi:hypothetical protein